MVEYLGRYTRKITISNHRILSIDDRTVTILYKNNKTSGQTKTMKFSHAEFIRRFAIHILPKRFVRIRHFGFLSSTWKKVKLPTLQAKVNGMANCDVAQKTETLLHKCPCCKVGKMTTILTFSRRGPPSEYTKVGFDDYSSQR